MESLRICCIEPAGNASQVFSEAMRLPLMGFLYLGTLLDQAGHSVEIIHESVIGHPINPFTLDADIFCITALTVSAIRAKELAIAIRNIHPHAKIIMGGIHASLETEYFEQVADHIVIGEAESIMVPLVEGQITDHIVYGSPVLDMDSLPLINYTLIRDRQRMNIIPLMTSRGCPYDCSFCSVTTMFGRHFRSMSPERIIEEIENALRFFPGKTLFFYDDNFTANRDRISTLCTMIIERGIRIQWGVQLRSEIALYPELIELMAEAGCDRVFIGFESINNTVLKALHKKQTVEDIRRAILHFQERGIQVHGMFMFGEDHDTVESIHDTLSFTIEMAIDTVQFMILTPFPGTRLFYELESQGRILHTIWNYFDGMFVVFQPLGIPGSTLELETVKAYEQFYSIKRTIADGFVLLVKLFSDALVINMKSCHQYHVSALAFRIGAWFLIRRFKKIMPPYIEYLESLDQKREEDQHE